MPELVKLDQDLSMDDLILTGASMLGYKSMPPTIDEFLSNPYFTHPDINKNLYPFWKEKLRMIYPTAIHTRYPVVVVRGSIGSGKSTFSRICAQYTKCRLAHLINPWNTFGLVGGKNIKFSFFSYSSHLAQSDFVDVIDTWDEQSPFFTELRQSGWFDKIDQVADGPRTNANIGSDVIFYNLSEINFVNPDKAHEKLDQAFKRWDSRFGKFKNYIGNLIIDTSSRGDDSIADEFANNNPYGDQVLVINTSQWEVRAHEGYYGRKGWFDVYKGDSIHGPFIISDRKPLLPDMDKDRVLKVPEELRADFEFDLITALQDKAGVSTTATDKFFPDTSRMLKCFNKPQYGDPVVKFDFFDKSDKLIYRFDRSISEIPPDKVIFIRYDIGVVSDNTGLAICYFDKWATYDNDRKIRSPYIVCPLAVGINRFEGQETPINHLFEFIMDLNQKFDIGCFTADQFASRQLLQSLEIEGIKNEYLSVDRTDEAYVYTKNLLNSGHLSVPDNILLKRELAELKRLGKKIDHPQLSPSGAKGPFLTEKGSKDIADALAGCVFNLYQNLDKAGQLSTKYKASSHSQYIASRINEASNDFQDMLNNMF